MVFQCTRCGRTYPLETGVWRCGCGGTLSLNFTPRRFAPELIDRSQWNIFRYRAFFPLENELWRDLTMGEGMTPVVRGGEKLLLKLDYAMPTLSFKDRGAALLIWLCKTIGVRSVIQDSSGNAGNSVAAYAARAGIGCEIFVPAGTSEKKIDMIRSHGAQVCIVDGSRDDTADLCRKKADEGNAYYANHVFNSMFYQGTKTYIYEVWEQLGTIPNNLFIPVGNGTLLLGAILALRELREAGLLARMPRLFAVQSERCMPLMEAWRHGGKKPESVAQQKTLAEGIAIGKPMRGEEILSLAREENITFLAAPEEGILSARAKLARMGMYVEHTTAATYAAYLAYTACNSLQGECLLPLCGAGLKSDH